MILKLEHADAACYQKLISWVGSADELMQFAGAEFSFPLTEAQLLSSANNKNITPLSVSDSSGAMIGYAEIHIREQSAFLCRILLGDKGTRGKGTGTQLIRLLLDYISDNTSCTLVELNVHDFNNAAIRCYDKAGFIINPAIKAVHELNGRTWTSLRMQYLPDHQNI